MGRLLYIGALLITIVGLGVWAHDRANARVEREVAQLIGQDEARADESAQTLARMGRRAVRPLVRALRESGPGPVQDRIARMLGEIGDPRAAGPLFQAAQLGSVSAARALDANLGNPRAGEGLALAYCALGERLLRDVERVLPVAQSWADALRVASPAADWDNWPGGATWAARQQGATFYQTPAETRASAARTIRHAERLFDQAINVHATPRAVRGLYRAQELAPDACECASDLTRHRADPAIAPVIEAHSARLTSATALCDALGPGERHTWQVRGLARIASVGPKYWSAASALRVHWRESYGYYGPDTRAVRGSAVLAAFESSAATPTQPERRRPTTTVWTERTLRGIWLTTEDLDGDRQPEVLVTAEQPWYYVHNPYYLLVVYRWDGRRLRELFRGHSELPVVVNDFDGDGDKEIVLAYMAARTLYAEQAPMWPVTYTLKNGHYVQSNEEYVELYRDALPDFDRAVRIASKDGKVLDCLARIYRILGRKKQALKVFKVALAAYKAGGAWGDIGRIAVPRVERNIEELEAALQAEGEGPSP